MRILKWDYHSVIETETGYIVSPAEILSHESDHIYRTETDYEGFVNEYGTSDMEYGNMEERRVITGSEQNVAQKLGRLPKNTVTRSHHSQVMCYKAVGVRGKYIDKTGPIALGKRTYGK